MKPVNLFFEPNPFSLSSLCSTLILFWTFTPSLSFNWYMIPLRLRLCCSHFYNIPSPIPQSLSFTHSHFLSLIIITIIISIPLFHTHLFSISLFLISLILSLSLSLYRENSLAGQHQKKVNSQFGFWFNPKARWTKLDSINI